jgi:hypothetical protein
MMAADQTMTAKWHVVEDHEATHLHIELWNGHSLTITAWKDDAASPFVALRSTEHGEHDLAECGFKSFRAFLERAQGKPARRTAPPGAQPAQQKAPRSRSLRAARP